MKKLVLAALIVTGLQAYNIGGAYATLVSCEWGAYGYKHGNIGTYEVNGRYVTIFFGSNYCSQ